MPKEIRNPQLGHPSLVLIRIPILRTHVTLSERNYRISTFGRRELQRCIFIFNHLCESRWNFWHLWKCSSVTRFSSAQFASPGVFFRIKINIDCKWGYAANGMETATSWKFSLPRFSFFALCKIYYAKGRSLSGSQIIYARAHMMRIKGSRSRFPHRSRSSQGSSLGPACC